MLRWMLAVLVVMQASRVVLNPGNPETDETRLLLETVQLLGVRANADCEKLEAMQQYVAQRGRVQAFIEKQNPGFTVDWSRLPARVVPLSTQ